jgi:hypothetical protein
MTQKKKIREMNRRGRFIQKQRASYNHQIKTCPSSNSSRSINPTNQHDRPHGSMNFWQSLNPSVADNSGCGGRVFILFFQIFAKSTDKPAPTLFSVQPCSIFESIDTLELEFD